jgi:cytochrome P450
MNNPAQTPPQNAIFSLFSGANPAIVENPFQLLAQLRSEGAVLPVPFSVGEADSRTWMVTRMDEILRVLKEQEHFTVDATSIGRSGLFGSNTGASGEAQTFLTSKTMLTVDDPDHRRLRQLVSKAFTPRFIEGLRPRVQQIADGLLDRVQAQGEMDLVTDYAYPLPINVIAEMLGVPQADWNQIRSWSEALAQGLGVGGHDSGVQEHLRAFGDYTARLVAEKRQQPADDLISQLIAIEEEGDRLSESELLSTITLLIFAGHETTANLIATGTLMLLDHPEQLAQLKADLSLVPAAVEELLRFNGPSTIAAPRFASVDIELGGQHIRRGDMLFLFLASANRDERQFTDPEDLEIVRTIKRHVAFGQGIHMCLGAPLARMEGSVAFTTLLTRAPNLRLAVPRGSITWHFNLNSRSLAALPVVF